LSERAGFRETGSFLPLFIFFLHFPKPPFQARFKTFTNGLAVHFDSAIIIPVADVLQQVQCLRKGAPLAILGRVSVASYW
jgi:hypothetical protein